MKFLKIIAIIVALSLCACIHAFAETDRYFRIERNYIDADGCNFTVVDVIPTDCDDVVLPHVYGVFEGAYIAIVDDPNAEAWTVYYTHIHNYGELII